MKYLLSLFALILTASAGVVQREANAKPGGTASYPQSTPYSVQTCPQEQTQTITVTQVQEQTQTVTVTKEQTQTQTETQTQTQTVTVTKEQTQTQTETQTQTQTVTVTKEQEQTQTQTVTVTKEQEQTQTVTVTQEQQQTVTATVTKEQEQTQTITVTQEQQQTVTATVTKEQKETITVTQEQQETVTATVTKQQEETVTVTQEQQQTVTATVTKEQEETVKVTQEQEQTITITKEQVQTVVVSVCPTSTYTTITSTGCPTNLPTNYQAPHLIVPVKKSSPSTKYGTSYNGEITPSISTLFNFDIPPSYSGGKCSLIFALPTQAQLQTSSFSLSGPGTIDFALLSAAVTSQTSYSSVPAVAKDYGTFTVVPGNAYTIASFACPAGKAVSFEMTSVGGTSLIFFEDYNPCPIGLFITEAY